MQEDGENIVVSTSEITAVYERPAYKHEGHTQNAFAMLNSMRKYASRLKADCYAYNERFCTKSRILLKIYSFTKIKDTVQANLKSTLENHASF